MTIDKAIQELEWELVRDKMALAKRTVNAIKLGIEAMDYIKRQRQANPWIAYTILKGETEDERR